MREYLICACKRPDGSTCTNRLLAEGTINGTLELWCSICRKVTPVVRRSAEKEGEEPKKGLGRCIACGQLKVLHAKGLCKTDYGRQLRRRPVGVPDGHTIIHGDDDDS
jgi:hypothetical protein